MFNEDKSDKIWREAEAKGIKDEIDHVEKEETTNDEGNDIVVYTVYIDVERDENGNIDEENSVGMQINDMPNLRNSDMHFNDRVGKAMRSIRDYVNGDGTQNTSESSEDDSERIDDGDDGSDGNSNKLDQNKSESVVDDYNHDVGKNSEVGVKIDEKFDSYEQRISDLEERMDEIEELTEMLNALKQIQDGD